MKTDAQVQQDVITELKWDPEVNAANIGVEAHDGVVTIAGHVTSYAEKLAAEAAAQRVPGVKALTVEIDVTLTGWGPRTDIDVARSAENALQWVTFLPKDALKVMVEKGWITLSGTLEWDYQRQNAVAAVRFLTGVKGITDKILIKPKAASADIKTNIEAALDRRVDSTDQDINVAVEDGDVTLSGTVTSWWQREMARESAWSAPGVRHVADRLTIDY
jgi:osmotically-inducible protein OsmY